MELETLSVQQTKRQKKASEYQKLAQEFHLLIPHSLDDFEKMLPAEQAERFPGAGEVEQARSYLKSQARWQVGKRIAAGVGIATIASSLGVTGALIHGLLE